MGLRLRCDVVCSICWLAAPWCNLRDSLKVLVLCPMSTWLISLSLWIQIFNRIKCTFFIAAIQCWSDHWYCFYSLAGMAELHPEECRSRLYRAGQRRQVGDTTSLSAAFQFHQSSITSRTPSLNCSCDRVALYDSGLKKNQWFLGGGWSGAWEHEDGLSVSSSLRSISARPNGIWEEGRGQVGGERASDHWFLCDTLEMALDFLPSFCHRLSFWFIYL